MKADNFIKLLRKIIREEVQSVMREELSLLSETPEVKKSVNEVKKPAIKNSLVDSIKSVKPSTHTPFTNNSILNDILNETAQQSDWKSIANMDSSNVMNFSNSQPAVVESVDQMLSSARPASDINAVRIDAVPDFSGLMKTMKEKGQI